MPTKARFIEEVGTRAWLRVYWDYYEPGYKARNTCPNSYGKGTPGIHDVRIFLAKTSQLADWDLGGKEDEYSDVRWPTACENCGVAAPPRGTRRNEDGSGIEVVHHILRKRVYNTASGEPEPGDLFFETWRHDPKVWCEWDNCDGRHLVGVLPNGHHWDIDGRARNCTMKEDRAHRCWIRHGTPPDITVDKRGTTCGAGAGSIQAGDYHGFLQHGIFTP